MSESAEVVVSREGGLFTNMGGVAYAFALRGGSIVNGSGYLTDEYGRSLPEYVGYATSHGHITHAVALEGESIDNSGSIGRAEVWGGSLTSMATGSGPDFYGGQTHIGSVHITDGSFTNGSGSYTSEVSVYGGTVRNSYEITTVTLQKGDVVNRGDIGKLTYYGGTYAAGDMWSTIDTLTLAGDSTGIEWGSVGNVVFSTDGSGILSIKAVASVSPDSMSQTLEGFSNTVGLMSGMDAYNINWANGNLVIDASALGVVDSASLISAFGEDILKSFGANTISGVDALRSVSLINYENLDEDSALAAMNSIASGLENNYFVAMSDARISGDHIVFSPLIETVPPTPEPQPTPEPATLVVLGLGLAGLGLARRKR